jgi:signal transduction histidine kinase
MQNGLSMRSERLSRWTVSALVAISLIVVCVLGTSVIGVVHDLELVRSTLTHSEVGRVRSHAFRSASSIQDCLRSLGTRDLNQVRAADPLRDHWNEMVVPEPSRAYAAVVNREGEVVLHSNPARQGHQLGTNWPAETCVSVAADVHEIPASPLSPDRAAIDVHIPIIVDKQEVGSYHAGLNEVWLEEQISARQRQTKQIWAAIMLLEAIAVLIGGLSLHHMTRRLAVMGEAIKSARIRRLAEVGQLLSGIVHEIRSPLSNIRINLHLLAHESKSSESQNSTDNKGDLITVTNREVERVENLMRILVDYARPDQPHDERLELRNELKATLAVVRPALERADVALRVRFPEMPVTVQFDPDRLRQVVFNLLRNAREATGPGGEILLSIRRQDDKAEIVVSDNGPGIVPEHRDQIFEPFFTTKRLGIGLGLTLARRFIEDAGGTVAYEPNEPRGARFCARLPIAQSSDIATDRELAILS